MPLVYETIRMECGYRVELMVENRSLIEITSIEAVTAVHPAQVLTYLRLANCRLGSLLNFKVLRLKDGIGLVSNKL